MGRPAIEVDVAPVGRISNDGQVETELTEQPRRHRRRRAIRSVDRHLERAERRGVGQRQPRMRQVGVDHVRALDWGQAARRHLPASVVENRFHLPLERLAELLAAA